MSEETKQIVVPKDLAALEKTCSLIIDAAFLMNDLLEELISKGKEQGSKE